MADARSTYTKMMQDLSSEDALAARDAAVQARDMRRKVRVEKAMQEAIRVLKREDILLAVKRMAREIYNNHKDNPSVVCLTLLNGGVYLAADLKNALAELGWKAFEDGHVQFSSYGAGFQSGEVQTLLGPQQSMVEGKIVVVIDDIMESGKTADKLKWDCLALGAKRVEFAMLIDKVDMRKQDISPTYRGFLRRGNEWFIGDGMDQGKLYRNEQDIFVLPPEAQRAYLQSLADDREADEACETLLRSLRR